MMCSLSFEHRLRMKSVKTTEIHVSFNHSFFQIKPKTNYKKKKNRLVKQASISRKKLLPHDPAQD